MFFPARGSPATVRRGEGKKYDLLQEDSSSLSLSYLALLNLSSAVTQGKISLTARSNRLIFLAIKNCLTRARCMIKSIKFLLPTLDKRKVNSKLKFCTGNRAFYSSGGSRAGARESGTPRPPIFGPNRGPKGRKKFFKSIPPLSQGLDD